jgi:transposase
VHLTETCDEDFAHLITHVETTPAPQADHEAVAPIHEALAAHDLLPETHVVDTSYIDAQQLVTSQQRYGVPTRQDYHWQAREGTNFDASQFALDWQRECATCPAGKTSSSWTPAQDRRGHPVIKIKFAKNLSLGRVTIKAISNASLFQQLF